MIRQTIPATLFVDGTNFNTVPGLSKTVSSKTTAFKENPGKWSKRLHVKLPVIVWLTMVYYNATITLDGPHTSPTAIFNE